MDWQPIETAPAGYADALDSDEEAPRLLVWVADRGVAFGRVYKSKRMADYFSPQAEGYLGDIQITHWMPIPGPPRTGASGAVSPPTQNAE